VRIEPEAALQCGRIVLNHQRRSGRELRALTAHSVIVIQLGTTNTHRHIEIGSPGLIPGGDGPNTGGNGGVILVSDGVGHEVWRWVRLLLETAEIPTQFLGKNRQHASGLSGSAPNAGEKQKQL